METTIDPATGRPLPPDAIQRILFIAPSVHIYNIPPLTSTKGYVAASWTADNNKRQIFTARLRVLETAIPPTSTTNNNNNNNNNNDNNNDDGETLLLKTDILLEDPQNGQLFAAAPYTAPGVAEQVLDSSRFFAVRVEGEGGRKAVLGVGFEERSEAFDFSVALQEVRKTLGLETHPPAGGRRRPAKGEERPREQTTDFRLKEGETITVSIGGRGMGRRNPPKPEQQPSGGGGGGGGGSGASFSLPPPPPPPPPGGSLGSSFLPPPPSAQEVKAQKRLGQKCHHSSPNAGTIEDLGFDDGEFGEFQ